MSTPKFCPCGSGKIYAKCCRAYHLGRRIPSSPLILIRTRFSALRLGLVRYIIQSSHPQSPHILPRHQWKLEILKYIREVHLQGFEILDQEMGDREAWITYRIWGREIHQGSFEYKEKGLFKKVQEQWKYHSGKPISLASS